MGLSLCRARLELLINQGGLYCLEEGDFPKSLKFILILARKDDTQPHLPFFTRHHQLNIKSKSTNGTMYRVFLPRKRFRSILEHETFLEQRRAGSVQSHSNPVTSTLEGPEKANFLSVVLVEMGGVRYQLSGFLLFLLGNGRFRSVEQNPH